MPTEIFDLLFIVSQLDGFVVDVQGGKAERGTLLDCFPAKFPPASEVAPTAAQLSAAQNQLWTFPAGPVKGSFFIASQLGSNLVVDIKGGKAKSGAELQIYTKKPTATPEEIDDAKNQLWMLVGVQEPGASGPGRLAQTFFFIQSLLDSSLVFDIKGAKETPGAGLQVFTKKPVTTEAEFQNAKNQLWLQVPPFIPLK
jgi:hypothetical protein